MQPGLLEQHLVPVDLPVWGNIQPAVLGPPVAAIIEEQLQGEQGCYYHGGTGEADLKNNENEKRSCWSFP